jgi:uncharacterized protein
MTARSSLAFATRCLFAALALCLLATLAFALTFPALTGRVVDQADIIPAASRGALETKLKDLEDKSGIQLVVATVKSLEGGDVETYANQLFRNWKLGEVKKNNGVLLLVAPNERKVRIEVGYGLEGTLTDALSSVIIQSAVLPRFKANDYPGGIERGVDGVIEVLTTDTSEWQRKVRVRNEDFWAVFNFVFPIAMFLLFGFVGSYMMRSARGTAGRYVRRGGRTVFVPSSSGWDWGSSSSGSGWSSGSSDWGGGFSGGGGSSGGGGASGSW